MLPYVTLFCLFAAADGAVLTREDSVDARLMRKAPPSAADNGNTKEAVSTDAAGDNAVDPTTHGPVSINLYYETRCPDCIMFINQTLEPLWRTKGLDKHLNITLNPYGNAMSIPVANVSEGYKFFHPGKTGAGWDYVHICQHGTDECFGNLIQACAIKKVPQDQYMELVFCMASKPNWGIEKSSYECLLNAKIDPKPIKECATSPEGNKMMAEFGKLTGAVQGRQGTPWVMIDGVNLANVTNLLGAACGKLGNGPEACAPFAKSKQQPDSAAQPPAQDIFQVLKMPEREETQKSLVQVALKMPDAV